MNASHRSNFALVSALALCALAGVASAQTLNLTPPTTPKPGDGAAAISRAQALEEEATRIRAGRASLGKDAFDVAIRDLAARLLRIAESDAGAQRPDASRLVLIALTLSRRADDLGAWIDAFEPPVSAIEGAAHDLTSLRDRAETLDADAILRGLRDALGAIWPKTSAIHAAWTPDQSVRDAIVGATAIAPPPDWLSADGKAALDRLTRRVASAAQSPAHIHAAKRIAFQESAARALADQPAPFLGSSAPQALRDAYAAAILAAAPDSASSTPAPADSKALARLAALSTLPRRIADLPAVPGPKNAAPDPAKALATNIARLIAEPPAMSLRRIEAASELLDDISAREIDEATLPRQLRVILRQLQPAARASRLTLLQALERVLDPSSSLSDPAILGARAAHRDRMDDIAILARAAQAITQPSDEPAGPEGPRIRADLQPASTHLLHLGQDLAKPDLRDVALAELRETCQTLIAGWATPDEDQMRRAPDARESRILARLDGARSAYLLALADPRRRDVAAPAGELRAIGAALTLRAQADLEDRTLARLVDWPGFEITPRAAEAMRDEAKAAVESALDAVAIAPDATLDPAPTLATIQAARTRAGPWLAVAALAREADAQGAGPDIPAAAAGVAPTFPFAECGAGAPDALTWMHAHVDDLAAFCRWAEEWTLAHAARDADAQAMFDRAMRDAAARLGVASPAQ